MPIDVIDGGSPEHQERMRRLDKHTRGHSWFGTDNLAKSLVAGLEIVAAAANVQQEQQLPPAQSPTEQE